MSIFLIPPCSLSVTTKPDGAAGLTLWLCSQGRLQLASPVVSLAYLFFHLFTLQEFILVDCPGRSLSECMEHKGPLCSLNSCLTAHQLFIQQTFTCAQANRPALYPAGANKPQGKSITIVQERSWRSRKGL